MPEQALAPEWPKRPRSVPDMRRLAKRVVDGMPKVQAAVLFGSRALNTARRDSDWDVALLAPERYKHEVLRTAPIIPTVSYVSLSPKRLRERHNHLGTLERSVVRDGVLLAGEWTMPMSQEKPTVSCEKLANGLQVAANHIKLAVYHLGDAIEFQPDVGDNTFAGGTQKASEHLAKTAMLHLEIDHPQSHKVLKVAEALRKKHPGHPWIKVIKSFNGKSHAIHVAEYDDAIVESLDESQARLYSTLEFHGEVLEAIKAGRPECAEYLLPLCGRIVSIVSKFQRDDVQWKEYPGELRQLLLQWKRVAAQNLEAESGNRRTGGK